MIKLFVVSILVFSSLSFSVNKKKRQRIYIAEYDYVFTPQNRCTDTISAKLRSKLFIHINLKTCLGKMNVKLYDSSNKIKIEEGNYINSLDLLKNYTNAIGITRSKPIITIEVYSYYQPLRSGEWLFYDDKGNLKEKKIYNRGVLIDSIILRK